MEIGIRIIKTVTNVYVKIMCRFSWGGSIYILCQLHHHNTIMNRWYGVCVVKKLNEFVYVEFARVRKGDWTSRQRTDWRRLTRPLASLLYNTTQPPTNYQVITITWLCRLSLKWFHINYRQTNVYTYVYDKFSYINAPQLQTTVFLYRNSFLVA